MRLINTSTRLLEEFFGENIPEYAILSHTWGKDEISLKEYNRLMKPALLGDPETTAARNKDGFIKITKCIEIAVGQGILYVWIDTCCIDKRNSSELSEAVNSMFRWYQRSKVCYVYLADVRDAVNYREDLKKSRWFTRGWTLQELIASQKIEFRSHSWQFIGSRQDISELSSITGIRRSVLQSGNPFQACVGERMSWASKRQTTRVEDMAYCLMGIFDVNMPLLYGEGEKAFLRLQQQIATNSTDHTLFAWEMNLPQEEATFERSLFYHRGLFARSPTEFQLNYKGTLPGAIAPELREDTFAPAESSSQTNRGFHLILPLFPADSVREYEGDYTSITFGNNEYVAILNCSVQWRSLITLKRRIGLVLTRTDARVDGNDGFARIGRLILLHDDDLSRDIQKSQIWIHERVKFPNDYSSLRMQGFMIEPKYSVHSLYPLNSRTNIITCRRPLKAQGGFVGVIRRETIDLLRSVRLIFGLPKTQSARSWR